MFDIGFGEMMLLAAIALIAIGPKQLPEVARTVGRMLNEFKRASGDFTKTFMDAREQTTSFMNETRRTMNDALASIEKSTDISPRPPQNPAPSEPVPTPTVSVTPPVREEQLSFSLGEHAAPALDYVDDAPVAISTKKES